MHIGPDDVEAADRAAEALSREFGDATGHDRWIAYDLLRQRWEHLDGQLDHWTVEDLAVLVLEIFPRTLVIAEDDVDSLVPTIVAFLRWFHDTHGLTGDPLPRLIGAMHRMDTDVLAAMRDRSRYGPSKAIATRMLDAEVDLDDPLAVQTFIDHINSLPFEQRKAMLPLPGDDLPPMPSLPPHLPVPEEEIVAAADASRLFGWMRGVVAHVGASLAVTANGNLKLTDGRLLVDILDTDDVVDPQPRDGLVFRTTSTTTLRDLDLAYQLALDADYLTLTRTRVRSTQAARALVDEPAVSWRTMVTLLLERGILAHHYAHHTHAVPAWIDLLDEGVIPLLSTVYAAGGRIAVDGLVDLARGVVAGPHGLVPPTGPADWVDSSRWQWVDWDVRRILQRLELAGVLTVTDVHIEHSTYRQQESGGQVELTTAGCQMTVELCRAVGYHVPEAGQLRSRDAAGLLAGIAELPREDAIVEVKVWGADRSDPLGELVDAVGARDVDLPLAGVATALSTMAASVEPHVGQARFRRLLEDPLLQPVAVGWLEDHGLPVPDLPRRIDRLLVSMAALGAPEEAVVMLDDIGLVADQISVIEAARAGSGAAAIPLLEAVDDLHGEKAVAKAARKALFKLGAPRHPSRRR